MQTLEEILEKADVKHIERYKEVMAYCNTRVTADEGIPAIIGLDDLTMEKPAAYEGAPVDEELKMILAAGVLVFTSLYEQDEETLKGEYPAVAPAMSAAAEMFFSLAKENGENKIIPYREVVKDFIK